MSQLSKEQIKQIYAQHKQAGVDYYEDFRAQLVLDMIEGRITEESAIEREKLLEAVIATLKDGNWKSAYKRLSEVVGNKHCPKPIIDGLKSDLLTYITENY